MATQEERKAQTKQKILDCAKILFEQYGFDATSVDQILKAANIAKGTFYQHFKTKLDILISLSRGENSVKMKEVLAQIKNGALEPLDVLVFHLTQIGEWFEKHPKIAEALIIANITEPKEKISTDPEYTSRGFIHTVLSSAQKQKLIKENIDLWEVTAMIGGFIVVTIIYWAKDPKEGVLAKSLVSKLTILLDGIKT